jgi:hypothetical protein
MMRTNLTAHARYPAGLDEPDCLACATGCTPAVAVPT